MTISFIGGDEDTGVSGIASRSSFVNTDLNWLFNSSAISLGGPFVIAVNLFQLYPIFET